MSQFPSFSKFAPKAVDFVDRVGATFAQAFLALAITSGLSHLSDLKAAAVAGAIAAGKYLCVEAAAYLKSPAQPKPQKPAQVSAPTVTVGSGV